MNHTHYIKGIFNQFDLQENFVSAQAYGSGHINDTYLVKTGSENAYILQRINHQIFHNVPKLMENIVRVTEHLHFKLKQAGKSSTRRALTVIHTLSKNPYYCDENGNYWRLYIFITNNKSYDIVQTPKQAFEGGKAFGQFQCLCDDLTGGPLFETIPNFHNIDSRYALFKQTLKENVCERAERAQNEINFVEDNITQMREVLALGAAGDIPLRVTHNDTKFNNVLLDQSDCGLCVIDLDTVMPGYIHYDFSDAIRTATNTACEDEADLSKIQINMDLLSAFSEGFLGEVGSKLNDAEWNSLGRNAKLLPFIIGLRFLTDFLAGDPYFKIHFKAHNLQRAQAQFELCRKIHARESEIVECIHSVRLQLGHWF